MKLKLTHVWIALGLGAALSSGCQSSRVATRVPATHPYESVASAPAAGAEAAPGAALPAFAANDAEPTPAVESGKARLSASRPAIVPFPLATAPDTAVSRSGKLAGRPDPFTTGVNVVGAVGTVAGVVMATSVLNHPNDYPGYSAYPWVILAITLFLTGIALMLFQGKNGRHRLRREARREARRNARHP